MITKRPSSVLFSSSRILIVLITIISISNLSYALGIKSQNRINNDKPLAESNCEKLPHSAPAPVLPSLVKNLEEVDSFAIEPCSSLDSMVQNQLIHRRKKLASKDEWKNVKPGDIIVNHTALFAHMAIKDFDDGSILHMVHPSMKLSRMNWKTLGNISVLRFQGDRQLKTLIMSKMAAMQGAPEVKFSRSKAILAGVRKVLGRQAYKMTEKRKTEIIEQYIHDRMKEERNCPNANSKLSSDIGPEFCSSAVGGSIIQSMLLLKSYRNGNHPAVKKFEKIIEDACSLGQSSHFSKFEIAVDIAKNEKEIREFFELDTAEVFKYDMQKMLPNVLFDHLRTLSDARSKSKDANCNELLQTHGAFHSVTETD